jgi:hypothetical protein
MTEQIQIPWGDDLGLGEQWWRENGAICGATNQQIIFSACLHQGWTQTASARAAKYGGNEDGIRQSGHRAAHSTAVCALLNLAHAATGTGPSGNVDIEEAKSILSRLARNGDPNVRLRSCETLVRIHEREQELARERNDGLTDIEAELRDIRAISPELAEAYAAEKKLPAKFGGSND